MGASCVLIIAQVKQLSMSASPLPGPWGKPRPQMGGTCDVGCGAALGWPAFLLGLQDREPPCAPVLGSASVAG